MKKTKKGPCLPSDLHLRLSGFWQAGIHALGLSKGISLQRVVLIVQGKQ